MTYHLPYNIKGESEHRHSKRFYERTNKRNIEAQIAKQESRLRYSRHTQLKPDDAQDLDEESSQVPPNIHHQVPDSTRHWIDLYVLLSGSKTRGDPALKVCPFICGTLITGI